MIFLKVLAVVLGLGGSIQHITSGLSNRISYIAKRYKTVRLAYFYGKEGETLTNHGGA